MKKIWSALLLLPIFAFAHPEPQPFPRPPQREISIEAQSWVQNCVAEPYVVADFIYWKVKEDGLDYAVKGIGSAIAPITSRGKLYEPDFGGKPGFKVGLGLNLAHDGWDLLLKYTWIYSHIKDSVRPGANDTLQPIWVHDFPNFLRGGIDRAKADWDLHTNILDLEWGRNYYISRFLTLRPFFGLKGYWNDQNYHLSYLGIAQTTGNPGEDKVHFTQDTWGIGVRFGTNTAWYFARNWSVYADMALSANWSKFDEKRRDRGIDIPGGTEVVLLNMAYHRYAIVPVLELGTGLRWEMWFNDDSYHALIQIGWEEQIWWNFVRFLGRFEAASSFGNLQYQGLTVKFQFDF